MKKTILTGYENTDLETVEEKDNPKHTFLTGELTQERLKFLLYYDPETGIFTWRNPQANNVKKGQVAGSYSSGRNQIMLDGSTYYANRLAWLYSYGNLPEFVDHEDKCSWNDRIDNLRKATRQQNRANSTSNNPLGAKGVCRHGNKYKARIKVGDKLLYLGLFPTIEEASAAYKEAAIRFFGEFANG